MTQTKRRARGEDSIYYDRSRDRWTGTMTVGWKPDGRRDRITVRGKTKTEVKHDDLLAPLRCPPGQACLQPFSACAWEWRPAVGLAVEVRPLNPRIAFLTRLQVVRVISRWTGPGPLGDHRCEVRLPGLRWRAAARGAGASRSPSRLLRPARR
jgi:hypothetical protein